jgi:hypothetical protein
LIEPIISKDFSNTINPSIHLPSIYHPFPNPIISEETIAPGLLLESPSPSHGGWESPFTALPRKAVEVLRDDGGCRPAAVEARMKLRDDAGASSGVNLFGGRVSIEEQGRCTMPEGPAGPLVDDGWPPIFEEVIDDSRQA